MVRSWLPYCGAAPLPDDWLTRWNGDPVLLCLFGATAFWACRRSDVSAPFWWGLALVALLFVSPLCALSSALFSARVVHHVLLTAIAAPLMVWGMKPVAVAARGGALWAATHVLAFWFWHAPQPYASALSSDAIYWLMQITLFGSALGFWAVLQRAPASLAIGLLLVMMIQMGLLGALITFAGHPLYPPHYTTTQPWGLAPIEDQQLAGLVMWVPAAGLYLAAALGTGWRLLASRAAQT